MRRDLITVCLLVLLGLALAQSVPGVEVPGASGAIPAKVEAFIEALIVVALMVVRGLSDPEWKTTFLNFTNFFGILQALNAAVIIFSPKGIPEAWQMMAARILLLIATLLFARKASVGARFGSAVGVLFGRPNSELPKSPPTVTLTP